MTADTKFSTTSRKVKPATLVLIGLLHIAAIYGLARAFAPDMTSSVERSVVSAFTVTVSTPEEETPPEPEPEPAADEGAAGEQGKEAVPKPVTAPTRKIVVKKDKPAPKAAATGTANTSGARDSGEGTGAAGSGAGTGSGDGGSGQGSGGQGNGGQGGGAVNKPVHVSGAINNARDYPVPAGGRSARLGTEVIVKVTVGKDGRASNCSVYKASPDAEADRITCRLVVERLGFKPAKDASGNPVAAPFYWRQRWF
ncbi:TonB family protein [Altererythrobacter confluentis]|uniref:TonB family protein n=1 Tax=Allopontixanthobacter confluentis TaxID=1849021 RepID=A0A6L7GCF2_9SPHN|nr:TonB family protein [Allopontixanthobacter confluentis]MXP13165.1 TonB family protein [Allopontixanthobacter confluentis]